MPIYESVGFGNDLHLFDNHAPFDHIESTLTTMHI